MLRCKERKIDAGVEYRDLRVVGFMSVANSPQVVGILTSPDVRLASGRVWAVAAQIRVREQTVLTDDFDVVIVGARCAGSPLAALLARQGVKVALVERATFPRDTLSTHIFEADALTFLDRLGVTEQLRATGAPFISRLDSRAGDFRWSMDIPRRVGDVGGSASIRRFVLDPILAEAAEESGAQVRMATTVTGLVKDGAGSPACAFAATAARVNCAPVSLLAPTGATRRSPTWSGLASITSSRMNDSRTGRSSRVRICPRSRHSCFTAGRSGS